MNPESLPVDVFECRRFLLRLAYVRLGGSSAADSWKSVQFATGAHYELAYPNYFGKEIIAALQAMEVIYFNTETNLYQFTDRKYVIKPKNTEQCFVDGERYEEVLDGVDGIAEFNALMERYSGKMPLPTRLIAQDLHHLNNLSFADFLEDNLALSPELKQRIDYQMLDDWGGKSEEVSALAGIHYYTCRPYFEQDVELFSPPNGNAYFIERMVGQLPDVTALHTETLVKAIRETEDGVEAEVIRKDGSVELVKAKALIYAGQKHSVKYIMPEARELFKIDYAPWVVLNIVCKKGIDFGKWQNDVLTDQLEFLGFVDSKHQKNRSETHEVLTAYYCFKANEREKLVEIEQAPEDFIAATIALIEEETGTSINDNVEHVNLKIMGHAMPIPKPGYLNLADVPVYSEKIVFAGVDTGRLPLFSEAFDSGLQAASILLNNEKKEESESGVI